MRDDSPVNVALLLGAGFSKWAYDLPVVSGLFDLEIATDRELEQRRVERLRRLYDQWKRVDAGCNNEAFIAFAHQKPNNAKLVNWYITRRLSEPFVVHASRRYTWFINSYYAKNDANIDRVRLFLNSFLLGGLGVITTNYDLIVEYALGTRGFNYGQIGEQIGWTPYPNIQPVITSGRVAIAKLHGSLSWTPDGNRWPNTAPGLKGKCLIVPPVAEKRPEEVLADQWALASRILARSHALVVFGFAFNEYDVAIREFFAKHSQQIQTVISIDVLDQKERLRRLFPRQSIKFISALEPDITARVRNCVDHGLQFAQIGIG